MRANNTSLFSASPSITELLEKCKGLSSQLKASRPLSTPLDLRTCIPSKELCHQLKQAYFRTFEGVFRILHVPSFERDYDQYWEDPQVASESFLVRLLLVVLSVPAFTLVRRLLASLYMSPALSGYS
jgi:hypothetical protein